jgi:hypothetical protein
MHFSPNFIWTVTHVGRYMRAAHGGFMLGKDGPVHSIPLSFPTICALGPWGECNLSFAPFVYCCRKTAANNAAGFRGVDGCTCSLISWERGQSRTPSWLRPCFSCCRKAPPSHTHTHRRSNPVNHLGHLRHSAFATAHTTEDDCLAHSPWVEGDLLLWRAPRGLSKRDRVQE